MCPTLLILNMISSNQLFSENITAISLNCLIFSTLFGQYLIVLLSIIGIIILLLEDGGLKTQEYHRL